MAFKLYALPAFACFLFAAILLYSFAGSPTPDNPGIVEILIALLLLSAVGAAGIKDAFALHAPVGFFINALRLLFLCGLIFPLVVGAWRGNDSGLIVRDLAAFIFLGLPLFLAPRIAADEGASRLLAPVLAVAGIFFALRTLMPIFNVWIPDGELLYLSNSPLALFAALFLAGAVWQGLQPPIAPLRWGRAGFNGAFLCIILAAMLLDVQRATIGAVLITLVYLALDGFVRAPRRALLPILVIVIFTAIIYPLLIGTIGAIVAKTAEVGLNARSQEAAAVVDALRTAPGGLFIGLGWGAMFASPAVAGLEVNYTHSLLTTLLLKGGLLMVLPALVMALAAFYEIFLIFQKDRARGLSLFWPFAIPLLLYASHKSLDYGLLLLMIGVWSIRAGSVARARPLC